MFQIAAAIGYAKKYNVQYGIPDHYNDSKVCEYFPNIPRFRGRYSTVWREHQKQWDEGSAWFNYHDIPYFPDGVQLFGFFQSRKYFEHCQDEVRAAFDLKYVEGYEDYVSIHVRRGDYVQHAGSFPPITIEYIYKALAELRNRLGKPLKFLVFSDDIQWCKDEFSKEREDRITLNNFSEFSEGRNEYQDLCLMASCGHHIIANSSFSWWAAQLGNNPDRIVITPSNKRGNWFGMESGVKSDCPDLIPDEWIKIEFR
jgi:hypothetical protein